MKALIFGVEREVTLKKGEGNAISICVDGVTVGHINCVTARYIHVENELIGLSPMSDFKSENGWMTLRSLLHLDGD